MNLRRFTFIVAQLTPRGLAQLTPRGLAQLTPRGLAQLTPRGLAQLTPRGLAQLTPATPLRRMVREPLAMKQCSTFFSTHRCRPETKDKARTLSQTYRPKTPNQKHYATHLHSPNTSIVLGIGPAGCGKTLFACVTALDQLHKGHIEKIVLTRPIVPVEDEEIGFLPGTLANKMDPWTRPMFDIILEQHSPQELAAMLKNNVIEISPLAFMRGRTFKNSFIIADEMQNSTPNQMLMLTTRLGTNSKLVITGDLKQSDKTHQNGLRDLMHKLRLPENQVREEIKMVEMQYEDVERSPIVKTMLDIYAKNTI